MSLTISVLRGIRQRGWLYSLAIIFNRIVPEWLFRCRYFVVYELDPNPVVSPSSGHMTVRWCESNADFAAAQRLTFYARERATEGTQACLAEFGDQPAGAFWATPDHFDESDLGVRMMLRPEQAWLFAAQVDKAFRRQGVYSRILQFIVPALRSQGVSQSLVAVNPTNVGSNRVHQQHAKSRVGSVLAVRLLNVAACQCFGQLRRDRLVALRASENPIAIEIANHRQA